MFYWYCQISTQRCYLAGTLFHPLPKFVLSPHKGSFFVNQGVSSRQCIYIAIVASTNNSWGVQMSKPPTLCEYVVHCLPPAIVIIPYHQLLTRHRNALGYTGIQNPSITLANTSLAQFEPSKFVALVYIDTRIVQNQIGLDFGNGSIDTFTEDL